MATWLQNRWNSMCMWSSRRRSRSIIAELDTSAHFWGCLWLYDQAGIHRRIPLWAPRQRTLMKRWPDLSWLQRRYQSAWFSTASTLIPGRDWHKLSNCRPSLLLGRSSSVGGVWCVRKWTVCHSFRSCSQRFYSGITSKTVGHCIVEHVILRCIFWRAFHQCQRHCL